MEERKVDEALLRQLFDAARDFYDDDDFLLGVCSIAEHDDDIRTLIDFIKHSVDITPSDVILLTVELNQRRFPEDYIWDENDLK